MAICRASTRTSSPGAGRATGTVTFLVGNLVVARVRLDANGQARLAGHFSRLGRFVVRAVYTGDPNFAGSSQSRIELVSRR